MGSSPFLPTWVEQRRALQLEPVIWDKGRAHETEVDDDACDADGGDSVPNRFNAMIVDSCVSTDVTKVAARLVELTI